MGGSIVAAMIAGVVLTAIAFAHPIGPALMLAAETPFDGIPYQLFGVAGNLITFVPILIFLIRVPPGRWGQAFLGTRVQQLGALVIMVLAPESLFDIGFQMSFAAVIALVATYEAVQARTEQRNGARSTGIAWGTLLFFGGIVLSTLVASAAVDTMAPEPLPDALDQGEWDRLRSEFVAGDCFDFLRPHGFARETPALSAFMAQRRLDELRRLDPLSAVRRLNEVIFSAFEYQPGLTQADSPIDIALSAGRGVCQDFAHIMLAVCRSWGLPARYVSGYLFTDRKQGDRSDPDATHAWVEVFLPSLRWVGFDPTNNAIAGERHIAVAVGRDYSDVPPSRGVYKGGGDSRLGVAVTVRRTRAAPSDPEFQRLPRPSSPAARRQGPAAFEQDHQRQQQQQQQQ